MLLSSILSTQKNNDEVLTGISQLASALLGKRLVVMKCDGDYLVLPVTPEKYQITTGQLNKTVNLLDFGEALLFGNAKLKRLKFSGFFPALNHGYPFIIGMRKSPQACVNQIVKWKESKKPVRVLITDSPVNHMMAIMDFNYEERDGTRDIYYTFKGEEYKDLNTPPANNDKTIDLLTNLRERPEEESKWTTSEQISKSSEDSIELYKRQNGSCEGFNDFRNESDNLALDDDEFSSGIINSSSD